MSLCFAVFLLSKCDSDYFSVYYFIACRSLVDYELCKRNDILVTEYSIVVFIETLLNKMHKFKSLGRGKTVEHVCYCGKDISGKGHSV